MATPTLDPQQIQQLIEAIQQLSAKLDSLSAVNHTVDKITDSILTYRLLFPKL
jgi:prefoldin subunit 5